MTNLKDNIDNIEVVIAGSEGFIGRELKKKCLAKGFHVVTLDIAASDYADHIELDIRSDNIADAIPESADVVINLAAISRNDTCRNDPHLALGVNVLGTLNLLKAATERSVKQFIFASTDWVYGDTQGKTPLTEEHVIDVAKIETAYALTKLTSEQSLRLAHQRGACPITVLRFGIVYGPPPNNWGAIESLFAAVETQDIVQVGSLATARRFIHISDLAEGICSAIGRPGFEVFNLSGNELISLEGIIKSSSIFWGRSPQVRETNPTSISIRNPDNAKARRVLGWEPVISLADGLSTLTDSSNGTEHAEPINS